MHGVQVAVDPGHRALQDRRPRPSLPPAHPRELVFGLGGELATHVLLRAAQHVHAEHAPVADLGPACRAAIHQERHQRRLQRHRRERPHRQARRSPVGVPTGHHRDTSGMVPEHVTEPLRIEPSHAARTHPRTSRPGVGILEEPPASCIQPQQSRACRPSLHRERNATAPIRFATASLRSDLGEAGFGCRARMQRERPRRPRTERCGTPAS